MDIGLGVESAVFTVWNIVYVVMFLRSLCVEHAAEHFRVPLRYVSEAAHWPPPPSTPRSVRSPHQAPRDFPFYGRRIGVLTTLVSVVYSVDVHAGLGWIPPSVNELLATAIQSLYMLLFSLLSWMLVQDLYRTAQSLAPRLFLYAVMILPILFWLSGSLLVILTYTLRHGRYRLLFSVMEASVIVLYIVLLLGIKLKMHMQFPAVPVTTSPTSSSGNASSRPSNMTPRSLLKLQAARTRYCKMLLVVIPCGLSISSLFYWVSVPHLSTQWDVAPPQPPETLADAYVQCIMVSVGWMIMGVVLWFCTPKRLILPDTEQQEEEATEPAAPHSHYSAPTALSSSPPPVPMLAAAPLRPSPTLNPIREVEILTEKRAPPPPRPAFGTSPAQLAVISPPVAPLPLAFSRNAISSATPATHNVRLPFWQEIK